MRKDGKETHMVPKVKTYSSHSRKNKGSVTTAKNEKRRITHITSLCGVSDWKSKGKYWLLLLFESALVFDQANNMIGHIF